MKEILRKIKADVILSAVLCIVLGIILFLYTEQATSLFCKLLAVVLIIMGAAHLITYFTDRVGNNLRLIGGIIVLLLGLWIFINPRIIINLIPAVIGTILFFTALRICGLLWRQKTVAVQAGFRVWCLLS